jgi:hypothetical protein
MNPEHILIEDMSDSELQCALRDDYTKLTRRRTIEDELLDREAVAKLYRAERPFPVPSLWRRMMLRFGGSGRLRREWHRHELRKATRASRAVESRVRSSL